MISSAGVPYVRTVCRPAAFVRGARRAEGAGAHRLKTAAHRKIALTCFCLPATQHCHRFSSTAFMRLLSAYICARRSIIDGCSWPCPSLQRKLSRLPPLEENGLMPWADRMNRLHSEAPRRHHLEGVRRRGTAAR